MKRWLVIILGVVAITTFSLISCNNDANNVKPSSFLEVYLTDAPADYIAVWIDIQKVMVHITGTDSSKESGWTEVHLLRPGLYNLLDLRNGRDTILASEGLPAGKITQLRLFLGDHNFLVLKGSSHVPLTTPSAQQSGLKLNVHAELKPGVSYALVLDFDATRSIVKAGKSGKYLLKPVIRTFAKAAGGAIEGIVLPSMAQTHVLAIQNEDTISTLPNPDGAYKLWGLPTGSYKVVFEPAFSTGFIRDTLHSIDVQAGEVTRLDTVFLKK